MLLLIVVRFEMVEQPPFDVLDSHVSELLFITHDKLQYRSPLHEISISFQTFEMFRQHLFNSIGSPVNKLFIP